MFLREVLGLHGCLGRERERDKRGRGHSVVVVAGLLRQFPSELLKKEASVQCYICNL